MFLKMNVDIPERRRESIYISSIIHRHGDSHDHTSLTSFFSSSTRQQATIGSSPSVEERIISSNEAIRNAKTPSEQKGHHPQLIFPVPAAHQNSHVVARYAQAEPPRPYFKVQGLREGPMEP